MTAPRFIFFLFLIASAYSCKKDTTPPAQKNLPDQNETAGTVQPLTLKFKNTVGEQELIFGATYTNSNGDTFQLKKLRYYISNISLISTDNSVYKIPNSYFLLDHASPSSMGISLPGVPAGSYKAIKFLLGVDSARNTSGAQTGALDPANGMFWSWNSGYIMMKLEGISPTSSAPDKSIIFHLGGYSGVNKVQREFTLSFNSSLAEVSSASSSTINLQTDIYELFESPHEIALTNTYYIMLPGSNAAMIADNYADMITFKTVE